MISVSNSDYASAIKKSSQLLAGRLAYSSLAHYTRGKSNSLLYWVEFNIKVI